MKKWLVLATIALTGCATTDSTQQHDEKPAVKTNKYQFEFRNGSNTRDDGYFALLEKTPNGWRLDGEITDYRLRVTDFDTQEALFISKDYKIIQPDYRTFNSETAPSVVGFGCKFKATDQSDEPTRDDYNPCDSSLTKLPGAFNAAVNLTANAVVNVYTLGLAGATGGYMTDIVVDFDALQSLIDEVDLHSAIDRHKEKVQRAEEQREYKEYLRLYEQRFADAKTSADFKKFIERYENDFDAFNLVHQARVKMEAALVREQKQEEARLKALKVAQQEEAKRLKAEQEREALRIAAVTKNIQAFRANLQAGNDSHCGLVIQVKKPLVQVQTSIGERWLKLDQTYPAGVVGCRFFNGAYQHQTPRGVRI